MSSSRILELANVIQANTEKIDAHLTSKDLPTPSFAADNPPTLLFGHGPEIEIARQSIVDATDELQALMLGPTGVLSSLFVCTYPIYITRLIRKAQLAFKRTGNH